MIDPFIIQRSFSCTMHHGDKFALTRTFIGARESLPIQVWNNFSVVDGVSETALYAQLVAGHSAPVTESPAFSHALLATG